MSAPGSSACSATCPSEAISIPTVSSTCQYCDAGKYVYNKMCVACLAGTYSSSGAAQCSVCQKGYYSAKLSSNCQVCSAGHYSATDESAVCTPCNAGSYSSTSGSSQCTKCPSGSYSSLGQDSCETAYPGAYTSVDQTALSLCPAGTYSNKYGASSVTDCITCPIGSYSSDGGQKSCTLCPIGKYSSGEGSKSPDSCLSCPGGTYADVEGASSCTKCPASTYSNAFSASSSNTCKTCPAGSYSFPGSSRCERCWKGTYSPTAGSSPNDCLPCPYGSYSDVLEATSCISCQSGRITDSTGSSSISSCKTCTAGKYASPTKDSCAACPMGSYSTVESATGADVCIPCESGSYSSQYGATTCSLCPAGKASIITGSPSPSSCFNCKAGYYSSSTGQSQCTPCSPNTYSVTGDKSDKSCSSCPKNTSSPEGSSYGSIQSEHPYRKDTKSTSQVIQFAGIEKYIVTLIVDIEFCPNGCDSLTILSGGEPRITLYKYAPTQYFVGSQFIKTQLYSPSGIVVQFTSDDAIEMYGYEVRISPSLQDVSSKGAIVSFGLDALEGIPKKDLMCDKYLVSIIGGTIKTFVPDAASAVLEYGIDYSTLGDCILNLEIASSSSKFLRSSTSFSLFLDLQEESSEGATIDLSYIITSSSSSTKEDQVASKAAIVSQIKLAFESGVFQTTLVSELEASGNPKYLEYSRSLFVNSSMVSVRTYDDKDNSPKPLPDSNSNPSRISTTNVIIGCCIALFLIILFCFTPPGNRCRDQTCRDKVKEHIRLCFCLQPSAQHTLSPSRQPPQSQNKEPSN